MVCSGLRPAVWSRVKESCADATRELKELNLLIVNFILVTKAFTATGWTWGEKKWNNKISNDLEKGS